ncbi:MAG: sulfotransferase [Caulobacterales bacterium]
MPKLASIDELAERAHKAAGVDSFNSQTFREGFDILLRDIAAQNVTPSGVTAVESNIVEFLKTRLRIEQYARENPEILSAEIKKPIFVMGIPRTGTTLLSNLLAVDPAHRSLLTWEASDPVPPPEAGMTHTDSRALKALAAEAEMKKANPSAGRFYRSSAIYPTECIFVHAHEGKALYWESFGRVPNYSSYMINADMTAAYEYERLFLQVLQHKAKGVWNLKMPSHALYLRYLLKVFPDARVIWTHRDPYTAAGSLCSLIGNSHMRLLPEADREWIGQNYPKQMRTHIDRAMEVRAELGADRIFDSHYADIMRDPMGQMKAIYQFLGDPLSPEADSAMRSWLDDNPQGKFGAHEYKLAEYGLSVEKLRPFFADYIDRFKIESEGKGQA